jgi:molybdopterin/thiamine biosynthesis adenylyltransferase
MSLSEYEQLRFNRQLMIRGFDPEHQERLSKATALVAGVGGVGGNAALYLAAAGIGRLILTHDGPLDLPDLNRQILMSHDQLGQERVSQAKAQILRLNPAVKIEAIPRRLTPENIDHLVSRANVLLDCRHNFPERYLLNAAAVRHGRPLVEGAMDDMTAYLTSVVPGETPCLACLFPEAPPWDHLGFAVMGPVCGALGCLMALEAIKLITGFSRPLLGELLLMDLADMEFDRIQGHRRKDCPVCGSITDERGNSAWSTTASLLA